MKYFSGGSSLYIMPKKNRGGWEYIITNGIDELWINTIRRSNRVRVSGKTKYTEPIGKYFAEIPRKNATKFFNTRPQALGYAKNWMRKHPRG